MQRPTSQDQSILTLMKATKFRYPHSIIKLTNENTVLIQLYEPQMDPDQTDWCDKNSPITKLDLEFDDWLDPSLPSNLGMVGRTLPSQNLPEIAQHNKSNLWYYVKHEFVQKYGEWWREWQIKERDHEDWVDMETVDDVFDFLDARLEDYWVGKELIF